MENFLVINDFDHHLPSEELISRCYKQAAVVINFPQLFSNTIKDIDELAYVLIKLELEKAKKDKTADELLDYNDEIVSIELEEEEELMDITVSGDNLFYANGILTKNSMGIVMSSDIILAMIRTEELDDLFQVMFKQLKNRFGDPSINRRFVVGMNRAKMKLYNLEPSAQSGIMPQATFQPTNKHQTKKTDDLDDLPVSRSPGRAPPDLSDFKF